MDERLEERCKTLILGRRFEECEKEIEAAMAKEPHSAIPHNLMGALMEAKKNHVLAMKHFRAAYELDPTYAPGRFNLEQCGVLRREPNQRAYTEADCAEQAGEGGFESYDKEE